MASGLRCQKGILGKPIWILQASQVSAMSEHFFFLTTSQPPWFIAILPNEIAVNWGGHHIWTNPCGPTPGRKGCKWGCQSATSIVPIPGHDFVLVHDMYLQVLPFYSQ